MSERGPYGQDPDPTEVFPPLRPESTPTPPQPLPPVGSERDPDPTQVLPPSEGDIRTTALPPTGGPFDPGPPYGGGGGGGGGGDEPPLEPEPEPEPWYRQPGPLAALIAGLAAVVVAIIALLVWARDDDSGSADTLPAVATSTSVPVATTAAATTTTEAATTTSTSSTTTTSTTTTTTEPPTTTTTSPPTTTTTTTSPPTTTTTTPITTPPVAPTAWDYVVSQPDLSDFREAVQHTPYEDLFTAKDGLYTFLIPDNDAFPPTGQVDWNDYVTRGALTEAQILNGGPLTMSSGSTLTPDAKKGTIGGAKVVTPDQSVGNGIVQVLDAFVTANP
jgi:hypothetical protein